MNPWWTRGPNCLRLAEQRSSGTPPRPRAPSRRRRDGSERCAGLGDAAETRAVLKQFEQAERDFAKALELEPTNPEWWIARGKYYLERGLDAQADADYQCAAELSPDDLEIFLRTGVWAVGSYPPDMNQSFPPEEMPHPSRPVKLQNAEGAVNSTPGRWTRIPLYYVDDNWGNVVLNSLTGNAANVSAYALGIVYSPRPRTASVMLASGQHLRLWVNGAFVYDNPTPTSLHEALERVPVSLQQGRNELLVRISTKEKDPNCSFMLRLADGPLERAWVAAQLMQWDEAVAAFEKIPLQQLVRTDHFWFTCCRGLAAAENGEHFATAVRLRYSLSRHARDTWPLSWMFRSGTIMPTAVLTREEWLALIKDLGEPTWPWGRTAKLRGLYRAGEFAEAVDYYNRQPDLANLGLFEHWEVQPILAMAYHQLGRTAEANECLQKANEHSRNWMAARIEKPGLEAEIPWLMSPNQWVLLTEANRLIRSVELKEDPFFQSLQQKIAKELAAIRPELADQDLALLFQPNEPRLWLARAQRFAELSRWEEAEADFQKATSLKSDDPFFWLAIGQYWRDKGVRTLLCEAPEGPSRQKSPDPFVLKASEAYTRAIELDRTQAWTHVLNKALAGNDALLAAVLTAQPQNVELWTLRGEQLCEAKRWAEAAEAWEKCVALGQTDHMTQYQLALLQAASGNVTGYADTCRKMLEQFTAADTSEATGFAAWACVLAPGALADYAPAVQLAQQFADANFVLPFAHNTLGAALLRSGRVDEAVRDLTLANQWTDASETMGPTSPAYAWYLLAIAHSQLGQTDVARQWYDKAKSWVAEALAEQERSGQPKWPWNRRLTIELLEREAAQAIQKTAKEGA